MKYNEKHQEIHDGAPVAVPAGFKHPPSIQDIIRRAIRQEISTSAAKQGQESFEEADDFDVDDDPEIKSPYELDEDQANAKFIEEKPHEEPAKPKTAPAGNKGTGDGRGGGKKPAKPVSPPVEDDDNDTDG